MAQKKQPTINDGLKIFKDVMLRASLTDYFYVNRILLSITSKGKTVLIIPEEKLLEAIFNDEELKHQIREPDVTKPEEYSVQEKFLYADELNKDGWIDIDLDEFYKGSVVKVTVDGFSYDVQFTKEHLPVKMKKSEYKSIQYKIILKPSLTLGIKNKFETKGVEDGGFTMMNFYQVV